MEGKALKPSCSLLMKLGARLFYVYSLFQNFMEKSVLEIKLMDGLRAR